MSPKPEAAAREQIDRQLSDAGWIVQDRAAANLSAGPGVAVREFPLKGGPVDYLLYVDGAAAGAVEAKKEGWTQPCRSLLHGGPRVAGSLRGSRAGRAPNRSFRGVMIRPRLV